MSEGKEIARELANYVNNMNHDYANFVETITREHPTLQQSSFGLMIKCIRAWAEMYDKKQYDMRNEDTCKLCHDIVEQFGDDLYLRFI